MSGTCGGVRSMVLLRSTPPTGYLTMPATIAAIFLFPSTFK